MTIRSRRRSTKAATVSKPIRISVAAREFQRWATVKPATRAAAARGTVDDRLAALEASAADHQNKLRFVRLIEHHDPNYGSIWGWMFAGCRVGFNTSYWMEKDRGQGAAVSLGTDFDRFGFYGEMEGAQVCPDNPTVGLYIANLAQGQQPNHGIVTSAGGSPTALGLVSSPNVLLDMGDGSGRGFLHRLEGVQVLGDVSAFYIGKTMADAVKVWPMTRGRDAATTTSVDRDIFVASLAKRRRTHRKPIRIARTGR